MVSIWHVGLEMGQYNYIIQIPGGLISTLRGHLNWVNDLILINNYTMASSSHDSTVRIWDLITNTQKFILNGHTDYVYGLKLLSFDTLGSSSSDKTLKVWNTTSGQLIRTLTGHTSGTLWSLDLMSDGQTLVSGSVDQTIKLWNWKTGDCLNTINTGFTIYSLATIKSKTGFFFIHNIHLSFT
jgi:WD40 repeat protein